MRVVLDTNVLVSALHLRSRTAREVVDAVLGGEHRLLTGVALLAELETVLVRVFQWDTGAARAARLQIEEMAELVIPGSRPTVCRVPDDDEFLAVAEWGHADFLVTGDKDLLVITQHVGTRIVTPRQFLDGSDADKKSGPDR